MLSREEERKHRLTANGDIAEDEDSSAAQRAASEDDCAYHARMLTQALMQKHGGNWRTSSNKENMIIFFK